MCPCPCSCLQPLAHRVLGIPRGDPKKTDAAVSQEQLDTLDKFKGAACCLPACCWIIGSSMPGTDGMPGFPNSCAAEAASVSLSSTHKMPALPPCVAAPPRAPPAESAYKCGVQVCFTLVLLLVGLNKPWFYDTKLYWADCRWPCDMPISYGERFVYCLVLGFYVQVGGWVGGWVGGGAGRGGAGRGGAGRGGVGEVGLGGCMGHGARLLPAHLPTSPAGGADAVPVGDQAAGPAGGVCAPRGHNHPHRILILPQVSSRHDLSPGGGGGVGVGEGEGAPPRPRGLPVACCPTVSVLCCAVLAGGTALCPPTPLCPPPPGLPARLQPDPCGCDGAGVPREQRHLPGGSKGR